MVWYHPNYYKELRKRNRDLLELQQVKLERSVPQSDQAISNAEATAASERSPGPGLKLQAREDSTANSTRGRVEEPQASSDKPQATSSRQQAKPEPVQVQASSAKRQASQPE